jgi:hypothetical protein
MRCRLARTALLALLLSLVTPWAVAWACAWFVDITTEWLSDNAGAYDDRSFVICYEKPGALRLTSYWQDQPPTEGGWTDRPAADLIPRWARTHAAVHDHSSDISVLDARGWPMLAMSSSLDVDFHWNGTNRGDAVTQTQHAISGSNGTSGGNVCLSYRLLPLGIIPGGYAVDVIFYWTVFAFLLSLASAPGWIRRRRRRSSGRCESCGYDRRHATTDRCPECGAASIR